MTLLTGRYRLGHPIGRGGMAVVHHATDEVLQRPVTVKTLGSHLREHGPMSWRDAAAICAGVARALAAAHAKNVVHHDVKPANIMLSPSGTKVVDFGLACTVGQDLTQPHGRVWGTPAYISPEQLCGQQSSPATDVYALGLVLHACLTGRRVWPGRSAEQVLVARACTPVPRLPAHDGLPDRLAALYRACLARSPKKRPHAGQVARVLADLAGRKTGRGNHRQLGGCRVVAQPSQDPAGG